MKMNVKNVLRIAILLTTLGVAHAEAADVAATGPNCDIAAPPAKSGEFLTQGIEGRVFPRLSKMPASYTGCQTAWAEAAQGWQVIAKVHFEKGVPVKLTTPSADGYAGMECQYADGKLVSGPAGDCFPYERLSMKSFPKSCAASFKKSGKTPVQCVEDSSP